MITPPEGTDPTAVGPFDGPLGTGPPGTPAPGTIPGKVIPGPSTVAGAWTTATALQKLDQLGVASPHAGAKSVYVR